MTLTTSTSTSRTLQVRKSTSRVGCVLVSLIGCSLSLSSPRIVLRRRSNCPTTVLSSSTSSSEVVREEQLLTKERRLSNLFPWKQQQRTSSDSTATKFVEAIGWALEERVTQVTRIFVAEDYHDVVNSEQYVVHVGWGNYCSDNDDGVHPPCISIPLPYLDNPDALGGSVWPSSIAGAILCQSPYFLSNSCSNSTKRILELGCGLGLYGLAAFRSVGKDDNTERYLTDNDNNLINLLRKMYNTERNTEFFTLDWRDDSQGIIPYEKELDLILGADVAYYYYLKMPLLNTLKFFLNPVKTMVMITGQAHRQSQWDLYDALCKGCYNQNTDTKDEPWKGITRMLLFKLNQARWETETTVTGISSEATIPTTTMTTTTHGDAGFVNIATIIHQTDSNKKVQFTDQLDHEATSDDRYSFYID